MTELNGHIYKVANKADNTFEITDDEDVDINSGAYDAYTSDGTAALASCLSAVHAHRKFAISGDVGSVAGGGLASLTAGNTLEMFVKGLTDDTNITIEGASVSINRV